MRLLRFAAIISFLFIINAGCARMIGSYHDAPFDAASRKNAKKLLESLLSANPAPTAFKGIGNVKLISGDYVQGGRLAWAAAIPDKIRIELLTPYGQPAFSFASNGEYVYLILHQSEKIYEGKASESILKKILSISIRPEHLVSILSGRPPSLDSSFITKIHPENAPGPVIIMQEKWWGDFEKIFLSEDQKHILWVELYNSAGDMKYRAVFSGLKKAEGYFTPSRLQITDGKGSEVRLRVSRVWAEANMPQATFTLTAPGK